MLCRDLELDEILKAIGVQVNRIFDTSNLGISLYEEGSDEWVLAHAILYGENDPLKGKRFSIKSGLNGYIIRNRAVLLFRNRQENKEFHKAQGISALGKFSLSWMGVPLISGDKIVGSMAIQDYGKENLYNEQDLNLFSIIASQVAAIIDRKRAEEALKKSVTKYKYLFDSMPNGYYLSNHEGYLVDANPAFIRMLGYDSLEELKSVYLPTDIYVSESERENSSENSEFIDRTEHYRLKKKDGRIIWIEDNARYIKDNEGTVLYQEGLCKDITDRKHAEEINLALFEISNAVNTTQDLEDLYASIHKSLGRIIDLTNFHISLYDRKQDALTFVYWIDTIDQAPKNFQIHNISSPQTQSHTAEVIMTGKPVLHSKEQFIKILHQRGVQPRFSISDTWLGVPLKIKEEVIGAMVAHSFVKSNFYTQKDMDLLVAVSEQVALAIERKRSEDRLQRSETRFRRLIHDIPEIAIQGYRLDGTTTYWNQASERLYGYTEQEAIGRNLLELIIPPEMQSGVEESMQQMAQTGKAIPSSELYLMKKDGSQVAVYSNHALVQLPDSPYELFCLDIDLTERKRAEAAQRESEERYKEFMRLSLEPIYMFDPKTNKILEANPAFEKILGYTSDEIVRLTIYDVITHDQASIDYNTNRIMMFGATDIGDRLWRRKDGRVFPVHVTANKLNINGKQIIFVIARDLTERKQAEAKRSELEAKNTQLQKVESLGRMAGAVAHHFNNQLSVVLGNLEIVLDDLPDDAESRQNLFQAFEAGHKAAEVSQQMLSYLGQISGKHELINLSEVCRQSLSLLQVAAPKGIILKIDVPASGPFILAAKGQIQQILANLISNAWESIPDDQGTIGLTIKIVSYADIPISRRTPLEWQPQPIPYACMEVSDTGCGISSNDIGQLFDPFFTTKFTGRGMGLPVVMGMVKAHGGCITVDSEPECGSVFRIYLPISTGKITLSLEQEKPAAAPAQKVENGCTVMLIEDEEMVRKIAKAMLTRLGYAVIEAQDGVEAVKLFQEHQTEIDCVLSDLTMPRMNGWETLTALRKAGADVPVILASGYDKNTVMAGDHPELPQAFLNKPYSMAALKDVLTEVIRL
jgi:PAS domain S-box-containing protein